MRIPQQLLVHQVTVKPYQGTGAHGEVYGASFPLQCFRQGTRKLVRDSQGQERVSSLQLYAAPGQADTVPAGSLVSWPGGTSTVMASTNQDSGGLGAPDHTEVVCE